MFNNDNIVHTTNNILQFDLINNNVIIPNKFIKHKIEKKNNSIIIKKIYNKK